MQGTVSAEAQAAGEARADASGATAYLNLESGDCHGDDSAVRSLLQSGVSRVVIGELVHLPQGNRDVSGRIARHPCSDPQSSAHPITIAQLAVADFAPGMRHPLPHLRGPAVGLLRAAGVRVDVLGEAGCRADVEEQMLAQQACLAVNEVRPRPHRQCLYCWLWYQCGGQLLPQG